MLKQLRSLLVLAPLFLMSSCGIGPGDYTIFRVAFSPGMMSADCGFTGPEFDQDSSTFTTPSTVSLFAFEDVYFLEFGDDGMGGVAALEGARDGSNFVFSGSSVDVSVLDESTNTTTTTAYDVEVAAVIKNKSIDGVAVVSSNQVCTGSSCPPDVYPISCTTTSTFRGSSINGTDIERPI